MVVFLVGATPASPLARTRATQASPLQERRYIASRVARSDSITFPHHVATPRDGIDARLLAAAAQPVVERVARAAAAPLPAQLLQNLLRDRPRAGEFESDRPGRRGADRAESQSRLR